MVAPGSPATSKLVAVGPTTPKESKGPLDHLVLQERWDLRAHQGLPALLAFQVMFLSMLV